MHMALLLWFGAAAINPYLAFATVAELVRTDALSVRTNARGRCRTTSRR